MITQANPISYGWASRLPRQDNSIHLIFLHSVQLDSGLFTLGLRVSSSRPECYADPLDGGIHALRSSSGVWAIPKLPGTPSKTIKRSTESD